MHVQWEKRLKQQQSSRTFREWMDRAILFFCGPAIIVGFIVAGVAVFAFNLSGMIATILLSIFTILICGVGVVLLVHYADSASSLFRSAYASPEKRVARGIAGLGIVLFCILLTVLIITTISRLGYFTGGDVLLMSMDMLLVAILIMSRIQQRQKR
jgi:hypothetical protein